MSLFAGLYLFEIVLLAMGVVLFLVTLFAIVYQVLHKEPLAVTLQAFLVIAVIMVGYPSIQSFKYKDGVIEVEKETRKVSADPQDKTARATLSRAVEQVGSRISSGTASATDIAQVGAAQYALGNETAAQTAVDQALLRDPEAKPALDLKQRIETVDRFRRLNDLAKSHPQNQEVKQQLEQTVTAASQLKLANPKAILDLAQAQTTIGDHSAAIRNFDKVIAIQPSPQAVRLREELIRTRPQ